MRKIVAGLLSAALASGLGVTLSPPALAAARPAGQPAAAAEPRDATPPSDDLPNPLEDKRRELRKQGLISVLNGDATPEQRNGSTVVRVGKTNGDGAGNRKSAKPPGPVRGTRVGRQTDRLFVILAEFGNERHPSYPDKDTDPDTPGPTRFDGPLHNEIPAPNRSGGQLHRLAGRTSTRSTSAPCTSVPANAESLKSTTRPSPPGGTASTVRSPTG